MREKICEVAMGGEEYGLSDAWQGIQGASPPDKYCTPARYPNGLPGRIPADAFIEGDAQMALSMAKQFLDIVEEQLR